MTQFFSRRQIIKTGFLAAITSSVTSQLPATDLFRDASDIANDKDPWKNLKIGIASYTFRKFTVEETIKAIQRLSLHYVSIKDFHLALDSTTVERKAVVQKFTDAPEFASTHFGYRIRFFDPHPAQFQPPWRIAGSTFR